MMSGEQASSRSLTGLRNNSALDAATSSTTLRARMHRNRLMMRGHCVAEHRYWILEESAKGNGGGAGQFSLAASTTDARGPSSK
jgi:hypothetical protein